MAPFFSVIVCTYNRARLLPHALRSLVQQRWQDWEAIVVDDGSTDATPLLLSAVAAEEPRVRIFRISHRGAGAARWYGIQQARGTYVTFLDSDDTYLPEHLLLRAEYVHHHPEVEFLHGGVVVIGNPLVPDRHNPKRLIPVSRCVVGGTFVIRRTLALRLRWPCRPFADDALFYERARRSGVHIARVDFPTYCYNRTSPDSLCTQYGQMSSQPLPLP